MKPWSKCTRREKIARWENVVRVLRSLSPHERRKHWGMEHWGLKTECGTVACAAGHCGLDTWFNKRGLKLIPTEGHGRFLGEDELGWDSVHPVGQFFGLDGAGEIFYEPSHRPVGAVIRECLAYIRELKKETHEQSSS